MIFALLACAPPVVTAPVEPVVSPVESSSPVTANEPSAPREPPPPRPPPVALDTPTVEIVPDVATALQRVLATHPRVLGVGEVHATTDRPALPSTMSIFTKDFLPILAPDTTDLVLETWRLDGRCGAVEEETSTAIDTDTKRPVETKSDLVLLAEAAVAAGVRPHDLALSCDDYAKVNGPDGIVYKALLETLTTKLRDFALLGLDTPDATVVLYGGAVHNDLFPAEALATYSYGPAVYARGPYVELDLYEPELVKGNATLVDPKWASALEKVGPDHLVLVERSPESWIVLLPTAKK